MEMMYLQKTKFSLFSELIYKTIIMTLRIVPDILYSFQNIISKYFNFKNIALENLT